MESHSHHHSHHHTHHSADMSSVAGTAFKIGIILNLLYVAVEFVVGFASGSMGLMSDAGHNLSDVAGMLMAFFAFLISARKANSKYTYGYKKSTILVSFANSLLILAAVVFILVESVGKIFNPQPVEGIGIMVTAGVGVLINGLTTWLFSRGKEGDLNIKATYLHMLADTLVSAGVILSGLAIWITGWNVIDPIVGICVAVLILISSWGVFMDSIRLVLDGVPAKINVDDVASVIVSVDGVADVHHMHIWAISTTDVALTAHIVLKDVDRLQEVKLKIKDALKAAGISHSTLEFEDEASAVNCKEKSIVG